MIEGNKLNSQSIEDDVDNVIINIEVQELHDQMLDVNNTRRRNRDLRKYSKDY